MLDGGTLRLGFGCRELGLEIVGCALDRKLAFGPHRLLARARLLLEEDDLLLELRHLLLGRRLRLSRRGVALGLERLYLGGQCGDPTVCLRGHTGGLRLLPLDRMCDVLLEGGAQLPLAPSKLFGELVVAHLRDDLRIAALVDLEHRAAMRAFDLCHRLILSNDS